MVARDHSAPLGARRNPPLALTAGGFFHPEGPEAPAFYPTAEDTITV